MVLVSRDGFDVHQTQVGHSWQNNFPRDFVRGVAFYFQLKSVPYLKSLVRLMICSVHVLLQLKVVYISVVCNGL